MPINGFTVLDIVESVRQQVQSGELPPGQVLPPVRDLALQLGVNRNTVASAYKRLSDTGLAETRGRLGTRICSHATPGEQEGRQGASPLVDLASGNPGPHGLPQVRWMSAGLSATPRLYGDEPMNPSLSELGRQWFEPDCPPALELNLAHGAVDAIERLAAAHLVKGDRIAVEDPCFLGTINALRIAGMNAVGVPVDAQGMRPDALMQALKAGARVVLITPRAHNPTGCSLTPDRAAEIRRVLAQFPLVFVIVDDHYALLSDVPYASVIPETCTRWAVVRSVSKALGPDLRLAFVASAPMTSQRLRLRLSSGMGWVSHLLQDLVESCLRSQDVADLIQQARHDYRANREALVHALHEQGIEAMAADGFNVWVPLEADSNTVVLGMAKQGWLIRPGEPFGVQATAHALRITVSALEPEQALRLASDLRRCL